MTQLADMMTVLQRVGYRIEDEKAMHLGTMAYQMATVVQLSLLDAPVRRGQVRTGRNDPCPCGSGRKYKKCCLKAKKQASPSPVSPKGPVPDPALVPNMTDPEAVNHDLRKLADLFESDPQLKGLRFPRRAVKGHLEAALDAAGPPPEGEVDVWFDKVAWSYVRQDAEAADLVAGLRETFTRVAARHRSDPQALRSLVLGSLCSLSFKRDNEDPDLLTCMLFRLSMAERFKAEDTVEKIAKRLGGSVKSTRQRLLAGDPELIAGLRQATGELDPEAEAALRASFEDDLDELTDCIREGAFPVPLPLVCIVHFLTELPCLDHKPNADNAAEIAQALDRTLDALDAEEHRLYGELLDAWLGRDDGDDPALTRRVTFVRSLAASDGLSAIAGDLLLANLAAGHCSGIAGEQELAVEVGAERFSPAYLEGYAELLERQGFPSLAHRVHQAVESGLFVRPDEDSKSADETRSSEQLDLF